MNLDISVIIPSYNFKKSLYEVLEAINNQTFSPKEIIIVDSTPNNEISLMIEKFNSKIPIVYHRVKKAFPGEARNIGAHKASFKWIAFLDSKTIPSKDWLQNSSNIIQNNKFQVVFGKTLYKNKNYIKKLIIATTYGNIGHETTPGSIISKEDFIKSKGFIEGVRTADDLEWRSRLRELNFKCYTPNNNNLTYTEIPNKISSMIARYFIYSLHTARVNIHRNMKETYFSIFLIFCMLLVPKWNYYVGWEESYLYIPNITKIYFFSISLLLLVSIFLNKFFFKVKKTILSNSLKIIILLMSIYIIFNWNKVIANWVQEEILYIPHITKIYLSILMLYSFFYRSIYLSINRKIEFNFIFPFNWLLIGFIGLLFDVVKAPGYVLGAILVPFYKFKIIDIKTMSNFISTDKIYSLKKILILCPYPINTAPGQRLKYEQYFDFLQTKGYQIEVSSFFSLKTYYIAQKKGHYFAKLNAVLTGYIKRIFQLFYIRKFDGIYIFLHVVPFTNIIIEKLFVKLAKKTIYDIDDLVFLLKTSDVNWIASYFKSSQKYFFLMQKANYVITCTPYLHDIAKKYNTKTIDISSTVNTNIYYLKNYKQEKKELVLGWSGSYSTGPYLKLIEEIIQYVIPKYNLKLLVIGAQKKYIKGIECELISWKAETEIEDLQRIDIGLYPLPNEKWVYGKSGLKAIQFMALGIPVVATAIGTNFRVIDHNVNGFLAKNKNEWIKFIKMLCQNESLRIRMGKNARDKVKKNFSVNANKDKYLEVFNYSFKKIIN